MRQLLMKHCFKRTKWVKECFTHFSGVRGGSALSLISLGLASPKGFALGPVLGTTRGSAGAEGVSAGVGACCRGGSSLERGFKASLGLLLGPVLEGASRESAEAEKFTHISKAHAR